MSDTAPANPFDPGPEDPLPEVVDLFPLAGVLLLPGGRVPLNIFEPRYLSLIGDALGRGRLIGLVQPRDVAPADSNRGAGDPHPTLYRIGCLGRIVVFQEEEDGRFVIWLKGLARFRLGAELPAAEGGYRRVAADFSDFRHDLAPPAPFDLDRARLIQGLDMMIRRQGARLDHKALEKLDNAELLSAVAMVAPLAPNERQALLEAPTRADLIETLMTLLEMGTFETPPPSDNRQ
ncbi:LON peptidase substrate-binding domain-containing protein [Roseospirillum parvum]|uniref:Lon N-terminal domain-containing protein n=1 Tax=Roseospirillum parvum TaxID=83401 RepID=A0A1G8FM82_9PROT|nr:LON peptidase substrate-binding domain-containing protein [Roseospirillum parvum]SDH83106.1 hypothetical protein SAMN05421742_1154 [Roseospirillum parvum]